MLHLLTAFTLGLITILDPCTLLTSITAVGYIDKQITDKRRILTTGTMFVLGKLTTYMLLSIPFMMGATTDLFQSFLGRYGESVMAVFLIISGIILLFTGLHHKHDHGVEKWLQSVDEKSSWLWSFMLGIFFAIAFCPHRLVYFITMIDLAISLPTAYAWFMPIVFGLGTGLPILFIAWAISYSAVTIGQLTKRLSDFEKWFRYLCAIIFIGVGIYLCLPSLHHHHHTSTDNETSVFSV